MKHKLYVVLSLAVLASMVLAACGAIAPAAPSFNGTATITFTQEPDNLNYLYTTMWFSAITRDFWNKGLWSFDDKNQPVPEIAAEIPTSENGGLSADGKTITVKLRDDVKWSDGEDVTADDFVFSYDMVMSDKNVVNGRYPFEDFVESVTAKDPQTLIIQLKEPFAPWLPYMFDDWVLPKHILQPVFDSEGTIDNAAWNKAPTVGVGPYVFSEWESGSHIIFKANPNWIKPPKLEQIFIRIVPDDAAQEAAITAGDTDIGVFLSSDQIEKLEAGGNVDVVAVPSGYDEGWFLNVNPETAHPAMLDVNVRKAIALATDRFSIVKDLLDDTVNPVNVTFWDNNPPYNSDIEPYPYDPDEANRLLDEAGWVDSNSDGTRDKDGVELVLRYITNQRQLRKDVQAVVQQMWAEVGIGSELVNYGDDYFNGYADSGPQPTGKYDIAEYSNTGSYPDPDASSNWLCAEVVGPDNPEGGNWQGYCNPDLDALFDQQATETDPEARKQLYYQIGKIMHDDVVWVGLWKDPDLWSISSRLHGVRLSGA